MDTGCRVVPESRAPPHTIRKRVPNLQPPTGSVFCSVRAPTWLPFITGLRSLRFGKWFRVVFL